MPLMLGKLYDALKAANVPDDKAREAAEEVATYEQVKGDMWLLKWMVGVVVALILGLFWMQWQMVDRLDGIEGRLTTVEGRLTSVEGQLTNVEEQISDVGGRLTTIETKLTPPS